MSELDARITVGIPTRNRAVWLREAVESVLSQTYGSFRLLISDNASSDETQSWVSSLSDPRVDYRRSEVDLGMVGNVNRVLELAATEYLVVLPDDDLLYPDYLATVLEVLADRPTVSVAHSAFDLLDEEGRVQERGRILVKSRDDVTVETGEQLIERSMRASGIVCWTSACFRTAAILEAGGLRADDAPYADAPLMMRIGLSADFACVTRPLVAVRVHAGAESATVGSLGGSGYGPRDDAPAYLYRQRLTFLTEASLPPHRLRRYRALARRTYRRDTVGRLTLRVARNELTVRDALRGLAQLARDDRSMLFTRSMLKLIATLVTRRVRPRVEPPV